MLSPHRILPVLLLVSAFLFVQANALAQCYPSVIVQNGVTMNLRPVDTDNNGVTDAVLATVLLNDLVVRVNNPCSGQAPVLGLSKQSEGVSFSNATRLSFDCTELGAQIIKVHIRDAEGNENVTETYVLVQDNFNYCDNPFPAVPTACSPDLLQPSLTLINGLAMNVVSIPQNGGYATLSSGTMVLSKQDNCSNLLRYRIGKPGTFTPPPTTTSVTFDCSELGTQLVSIWARDGAGNWTYADTYIILQDGLGVCGNAAAPAAVSCTPDVTPPVIMLRSGIATSFTEGLSATLNVSDFVYRVTDDCSSPTDIRVARSGTTAGPPQTTSVTFDCADPGIQLVEVWARDAAGNWSFAETFVSIQITAPCSPAPKPGAQRLWPEALDTVINRQ